jgi:hypothetical protein
MTKNQIFDIPAGIVALSSDWNPHLGDAFELVIKEMARLDNHRIDFGCAIEGGAFNIAYDDPTTPTIDKTHQEISLVTFLWNLVARLQSLGTAPAIKVPEYFKALG